MCIRDSTITILLGLTVGASTQASEFLTLDSIKIFALGALSFIIATASGVIFVKIFNIFLKKGNKINPLIGNAGVSAVPDSARISQVIGLEYDSTNYLLMHAMGPVSYTHLDVYKRQDISRPTIFSAT